MNVISKCAYSQGEWIGITAASTRIDVSSRNYKWAKIYKIQGVAKVTYQKEN